MSTFQDPSSWAPQSPIHFEYLNLITENGSINPYKQLNLLIEHFFREREEDEKKHTLKGGFTVGLTIESLKINTKVKAYGLKKNEHQ